MFCQPQLHVGWSLTCNPFRVVILSFEGDDHVLVLSPTLVLALGHRLVLLKALLTHSKLCLSLSQDSQEEKGSKKSEGPHG